MKGIIKPGAKVCQNMRVFDWPPDLSHIIFDIKEVARGFNCVAEGYGGKGSYGCGSVFVPSREDISEVSVFTEDELKELSKQLVNMGFDKGFTTAVGMVRVAAIAYPEKVEFLTELASMMESSLV